MTQRTTGRRLFISFRNSFGPTKLRCGCPGILSCRKIHNVRRVNNYCPSGDLCLPFVHGTINPVSCAPKTVVDVRPGICQSRHPGTTDVKAHTCRLTLFIIFRDNLRVLTSGPALCCHGRSYAHFVARIPMA